MWNHFDVALVTIGAIDPLACARAPGAGGAGFNVSACSRHLGGSGASFFRVHFPSRCSRVPAFRQGLLFYPSRLAPAQASQQRLVHSLFVADARHELEVASRGLTA